VTERERLLCAREVAELLGLSPATVLDRFEAGDLPGFKLYGKRGGPVRFRWSEIDQALEGWRRADAPGREVSATRTGSAHPGRGYPLKSLPSATAPHEAAPDEKE
jgi:predicted DNA-binding transcriptional regulator AlpA